MPPLYIEHILYNGVVTLSGSIMRVSVKASPDGCCPVRPSIGSLPKKTEWFLAAYHLRLTTQQKTSYITRAPQKQGGKNHHPTRNITRCGLKRAQSRKRRRTTLALLNFPGNIISCCCCYWPCIWWRITHFMRWCNLTKWKI